MIIHALNLLNEPHGPVLTDYPYDAADEQAETAVPACPVDFSSRSQDLTGTDKLLQQFQSEFNGIHTWYIIAREKKGRTTSGVSGLNLDKIIILYTDFLSDNQEALKPIEQNLADTLRLATEDLKSCYFEALSSQPSQPTDVASLSNWFWGETYAAAVINEVRKKCIAYGTKDMALAGKLLLIPRNQMYRFKE